MNNLFGIRIDKKPVSEILQIVKETVETSKKFHIVTLNTELLVASKADKKLRQVVNQADLVLPESSGIYLADHYLASKGSNKFLRLLASGLRTLRGNSNSLETRVAGVELSYALAGLAAEHGFKLVLLGGGEAVAGEAASKLSELYPKLKVSGVYGGRLEVNDSNILIQVQEEEPDILLVGFGQPKQEYWIAENFSKIPAKVAVGVGGTLDFMAGKVPRAPKLVRNLGMEWAFRLAVQPWRIKRQLALVKFINLLIKS